MGRKNVGHPLSALLVQAIERQGATISKLAVELGISQSYLSELLGGDKSFSKLDDELVRAMALYINIPAVVAFILSGKLCHRDFIDGAIGLEDRLQGAMYKVGESSYALEAAVTIPTLMKLPTEVKLLLVLVFQEATGDSLIPLRRWPLTQAKSERK